MTMTRENIFSAIRIAIKTATGVPMCVMASPGSVAPSGEYAEVEPMQVVNGNAQPLVTQNAGDSQTIIGNVHVECNVNFYRGDARARAAQLRYAGHRNDVIWPLYNVGLHWQRVGPINNLSALQSSRVEQRANVTIYLMFKEIAVTNLNTVLYAPVDVEYSDGTIVYSENTNNGI